MDVCYKVKSEVSNDNLSWGFYNSAGELFAFGSASQGIEFPKKTGALAEEYYGNLPLVIPGETLEPSNKTDILSRFLLTQIELMRAYERIEELEG